MGTTNRFEGNGYGMSRLIGPEHQSLFSRVGVHSSKGATKTRIRTEELI